MQWLLGNIKYAWYLLRHKFWAFHFCVHYGIWWQGIIHDWDKFYPYMWKAYADRFQISHTKSEAFAQAWKDHYTRQKHHPGHWVITNPFAPEAQAGEVAYEMPEEYVFEMIADWKAASMAQHRHASIALWYLSHKDTLPLHSKTRRLVEDILYGLRTRCFKVE